MSVLSSTPAFMLNLNTQGLFSSQTAFQRPKLNNKQKNVPQAVSRIHLNHSAENLTSRTYKPVQITLKNEDSDLLICEPIKKVKSIQGQSQPVNLLKHTQNDTQQKPSKLTVEMVFDVPVETKKSKLNNFFDEDQNINEDSSLSFISSCTSIDGFEGIDEETTEENNECMIIGARPNSNTSETPLEPLVVKDSFAGHLTYLNTASYITSNITNYPIMASYNHYNDLESAMLYHRVSNINQFIQPELTKYQPIQAMMNFPQIRAGDFVKDPISFLLNEKDNQFENIRAKNVEIEEDDCDSDSYATRSTGLELNQDGIEKSQKSASPLYSIGEELLIEEKIRIASLEDPKKKKRGRKPKNFQRGPDEVDGSMKAKKGRALNLDIDINPKHLKVERRLNKLQLLRYQQEAPEGEFEQYMKRLTEMEPLSRNNSLFNDSQSTTSENRLIDSQVTPIENTLATIPPLSLEPRRKVNLVTRWTPSNLNREELEHYFKQLSELVEFPVTDQERGLGLLKTFGMNMTATIEAVKQNPALYGELLRVKVKRVRRR